MILCKFHSVFLSEDGQVLTSGHGRGGRLGHDSEQSVIVSMSSTPFNHIVSLTVLYELVHRDRVLSRQ